MVQVFLLRFYEVVIIYKRQKGVYLRVWTARVKPDAVAEFPSLGKPFQIRKKLVV
jgi:hypothetical protein